MFAAVATFDVALPDQTGLARIIMPVGEFIRALSRTHVRPDRDALRAEPAPVEKRPVCECETGVGRGGIGH